MVFFNLVAYRGETKNLKLFVPPYSAIAGTLVRRYEHVTLVIKKLSRSLLIIIYILKI